MLIFTRKTNQSIDIGIDVKVVILGARNGRVRVGIIAPQEIQVDRSEVTARREQERRQNKP